MSRITVRPEPAFGHELPEGQALSLETEVAPDTSANDGN